MAYTVSVALLTAASTTGRSATTLLGYLPGRSFSLTTAGFTGTIQVQTSTDGGTTWTNCQYENSSGQIASTNLTYTTDTATYTFWVASPNALFSLNVSAASAGTVSATYFASDTVTTLPSPTGVVSQGAPAALANAWPTTENASAVGGASKSKLRNLAATVQAVKASAGTVYGGTIVNNTAAICFVQVFDVAAGSVTLATTTPDLEFQVAANSSLIVNLPSPGVAFGTAISIASTTTEGGLTGSASGVQVNLLYA